MKVLSPEILLIATGPRVSFSGSHYLCSRFGETVQARRGLSPWRVNKLSASELGRTRAFRMEATKEAEEATRWYGVLVVGLTRSRGVDGVMSVAS